MLQMSRHISLPSREASTRVVGFKFLMMIQGIRHEKVLTVLNVYIYIYIYIQDMYFG